MTEDIAKACETIEKNGFSLTLSDILVVEIDDEIGAFSKIVSILSENDVDINYCYTLNSDKKGAFAVKVSDLNKAKKLLERFRIY